MINKMYAKFQNSCIENCKGIKKTLYEATVNQIQYTSMEISK